MSKDFYKKQFIRFNVADGGIGIVASDTENGIATASAAFSLNNGSTEATHNTLDTIQGVITHIRNELPTRELHIIPKAPSFGFNAYSSVERQEINFKESK